MTQLSTLNANCPSFVISSVYENKNFPIIKEIINDLDIELIDLKDELFNKFKNPLEFYTFKIGPHLNINGYKVSYPDPIEVSTQSKLCWSIPFICHIGKGENIKITKLNNYLLIVNQKK